MKPAQAETTRAYVQGMHEHWLRARARQAGVSAASTATIETRFRYNPEVAASLRWYRR